MKVISVEEDGTVQGLSDSVECRSSDEDVLKASGQFLTHAETRRYLGMGVYPQLGSVGSAGFFPLCLFCNLNQECLPAHSQKGQTLH